MGKLLSARTDPLPDFWAALITFAVGTMDADQGMVTFRGDNWPPNGFNFAFHRNPQVYALLARGRSAVSRANAWLPTGRRNGS